MLTCEIKQPIHCIQVKIKAFQLNADISQLMQYCLGDIHRYWKRRGRFNCVIDFRIMAH